MEVFPPLTGLTSALNYVREGEYLHIYDNKSLGGPAATLTSFQSASHLAAGFGRTSFVANTLESQLELQVIRVKRQPQKCNSFCRMVGRIQWDSVSYIPFHTNYSIFDCAFYFCFLKLLIAVIGQLIVIEYIIAVESLLENCLNSLFILKSPFKTSF